MSEATYRILNETGAYREMLGQITTSAKDLSLDAWHTLANFVQESPEQKYVVLGGLGAAILFVLILIKRTRFF